MSDGPKKTNLDNVKWYAEFEPLEITKGKVKFEGKVVEEAKPSEKFSAEQNKKLAKMTKTEGPKFQVIMGPLMSNYTEEIEIPKGGTLSVQFVEAGDNDGVNYLRTKGYKEVDKSVLSGKLAKLEGSIFISPESYEILKETRQILGPDNVVHTVEATKEAHTYKFELRELSDPEDILYFIDAGYIELSKDSLAGVLPNGVEGSLFISPRDYGMLKSLGMVD